MIPRVPTWLLWVVVLAPVVALVVWMAVFVPLALAVVAGCLVVGAALSELMDRSS